jgi:mannose-6-phosphate isomerase-like protein (cupin superfamily)
VNDRFEAYKETRARRVVVGENADGRSEIQSDGDTDTRLVTDAYVLNQIWQATQVPIPVDAGNSLTDVAVIPPPPAGFTFVIATFPPDEDWDYVGGYARALADAGAEDAAIEGGIPGLHQTDTLDLVTVISGEVYAVFETGETLLRPGDSLVQQGGKHAWSNRGDVPCVIAALQVALTR